MATQVHNDVIEQGATFYREVSLYSDASKTQALSLESKTLRASLMLPSGQHVADFSCVILNAATGVFAWTMSRTLTNNLDPARIYIYIIDLDDAVAGTSDRVLRGDLSVKVGQELP